MLVPDIPFFCSTSLATCTSASLSKRESIVMIGVDICASAGCLCVNFGAHALVISIGVLELCEPEPEIMVETCGMENPENRARDGMGMVCIGFVGLEARGCGRLL